MGWTITIVAAGAPNTRGEHTITDEQVDAFLNELADHGGVVTTTPEESDRDGYGATLSVADATSPADAVQHGLAIFSGTARRAGLPALPVVHVEALTFAEHDRELERPDRQLVGLSEMAGLLGISRQRASALQTRAGFPSPLATLASGPVWEVGDVTSFRRTWSRKPGRPRKVDA